jgi:hypothetical protein
MNLFAFALLLSTSPSFASADQTVKHDDWAGGANDLLGSTSVDLEPQAKRPAPQITLSCTDENGAALRKKDAGYDECVRRSTGPAATGAAVVPKSQSKLNVQLGGN